MYWEQKVEFAALSDIGFRRRNNQDSYAVQIASDKGEWTERGHLFLVADGMGGHAVGELASKIAADTIPHTYHKLREQESREALPEAVRIGNATINARGELNRDFTRMGTTCTTLVLYPHGALVAHVGDTRVYRIRGERIEQLTFDHSLQWELLRQGAFSPEEVIRREPRNVITRSLGPSPSVQVDREGPFPTRPGDVYLLCSDGLSSLVDDNEIGIVARELAPPEACRLLVNLANLRGGPDNITVVVVRVGAIPPDLPQDDPPPPIEPAPSRGGWLLPVGWFLAGLCYIVGNALPYFDRPLEGIALEGLGLIGIGGLIFAWVRGRRLTAQRAAGLGGATGAPYRTASARLTATFVNELAALESNLQRTAQEEGWSIDWNEHAAVFQSARVSLAAGRYSDALKGFASALNVLMTGIHLLRKQREQAARWGVKPPRDEQPEPGSQRNV
jgi:protein phosphatase